MTISLYTSRIVLNTIGVEDYGIYTVVGGLVMLFSSLNVTMATAVQRFLNFEMGRNNGERLRKVFSTSVLIHIVIAVIVFLLLETIGVWFLNQEMNIPKDRVGAANWVLQFSILSFIITVLSVPYHAAIIANERMKAFAFIGIVEVLLKLFVVFSLFWISFDRLKAYSILIFAVSLLIRLSYVFFSIKKFPECRIFKIFDRELFKEMGAFAGWNLIGVTSTLVRTQGINIALNLFYGVVVNAAMGIVNQVRTTLDNFSNSFLMAINPQITKSYAAGDAKYLMKLVFSGSRYAFYLLFILTLPVFFETDFILSVWLGSVPEYTGVFLRLVLLTVLIESLSKTLIQSMFATGNIRKYQLIVGSITILNLPISVGLFYFGFPPYSAFVVGVCIAILSLFVRLSILKRMIDFSVSGFIRNVIGNVFLVGSISLLVPYITHSLLDYGVFRFVLVGIACLISVFLSVFFVGLSISERSVVLRSLHKLLVIKY